MAKAAARGILIRHDLDDDPHVLAICEELGIDTDVCIAKLRRIWRHADSHTDDGWIPFATNATIDRIIGLAGFSAAMTRVGWLELRLSGVQVPEFQQYMGPRAAAGPDGKRRTQATEWPGFDEFWKVYPKRRAKKDARKAWDALKPEGAVLARVYESLRRDAASEEWRKENGRFIPHPATWLNGWRWEDEPGVDQPGRVRSEPGKYAHLSKPVLPAARQGPAPGLFGEQAEGHTPDPAGVAPADPGGVFW